jgi:excisionase family DNA binding protein
MSGELLTTGQAAKLLGSSRQQVVNLCERGDLPFVRVGAHRKVRREHVEALLRPKQALTRDQLKSLWLHQAVAGGLVVDPDKVLGQAQRLGPGGMKRAELEYVPESGFDLHDPAYRSTRPSPTGSGSERSGQTWARSLARRSATGGACRCRRATLIASAPTTESRACGPTAYTEK